MTAQMILGILATHGGLGAELRRTAESILGPQDALAIVSNSGKAPDTLLAELEALIVPGQRAVLFVDLLGGSCGHVCALVQRRHPQVLLAGGVNLPMLLEFLYHRQRVGPGELRERLISRGCEGIRCLGWESEAVG